MSPNRYELPRSFKSITNINFGQGTAKITEVRVGDRKKICQFSLTQGVADVNPAKLVIFFFTSNFGL